jgi:hypothetical protein
MCLLFSNFGTYLARLNLKFSRNFFLKLILPELDMLLIEGRFMGIFIIGKKFRKLNETESVILIKFQHQPKNFAEVVVITETLLQPLETGSHQLFTVELV